MRIAVIHRDRLYRECLGYCLMQMETISIVHSASGLEEDGAALLMTTPDLLMVEFDLSRKPGEIRTLSLKVKTMVLGVPDTEEDILGCIEITGASGYLLREATLADLIGNIQAIMRGETLCSPRIASLTFCRISSLANQKENNSPTNKIMLTRRESEIVTLIDSGLSNKEIAVRLRIEVSTVKNHVHNILEKLQLRDRHSVVRYVKEI